MTLSGRAEQNFECINETKLNKKENKLEKPVLKQNGKNVFPKTTQWVEKIPNEWDSSNFGTLDKQLKKISWFILCSALQYVWVLI